MNDKCWCEEPLATILLRTPWRDAGVQPMLHCPKHGDLDSRQSLVARAEAAEAEVEQLRDVLGGLVLARPVGIPCFCVFGLGTPGRHGHSIGCVDARKALEPKT